MMTMRSRTPWFVVGMCLLMLIASPMLVQAQTAAPPVASEEQVMQASTLYLPMITRNRVATVLFGTGSDAEGNLTGVATTFPSGIGKLYYLVLFDGYQGSSYTFQLSVNNSPVGGPSSGSIPNQPAAQVYGDGGSVCMVEFTACTGRPLPKGIYTVIVTVDGVQEVVGTATIQ